MHAGLILIGISQSITVALANKIKHHEYISKHKTSHNIEKFYRTYTLYSTTPFIVVPSVSFGIPYCKFSGNLETQ